ncbi:MAG TPA: ester cyclase [Kofleriaceae bacterium]
MTMNDSKLEANKTLVRKFVDVVKNQRKLDQLGEFFAADYREHNETVAAFGPGIVGYQNFLGHLFSAFPDDVLKIELITADGDLVSYRAIESGTHKGEFLKIPATGKSASWTEIQFFRIANGKVVEHWVDVDIYGWFQQLGVIPPN